MRTKRLFCDGWEFAKCEFGTDYESATGFTAVDLPHDWLIYDTLKLYETATGWYRRTLKFTPDGNRRILSFEGVYMDSHVYVNGVQAFEWKYGYTTFEVDITDYLTEGDNVIAVRVDHKEPNTRWYSGAGIFRPVYLISCAPEHVTYGGVYISAYEDGRVLATVETERPENVSAIELKIKNTVYNGEEKVAESIRPALAFDISQVNCIIKRDGCLYTENTDTLYVEKPELWDIENPKLYRLVTEVVKGEQVVDCVETKFGFRTIEFTTDKGFFLNHRHVKLHGACEHHDLGALGAAINKEAMRRKIKNLQSMGINAVRTSHNPPAKEWMELFDEMGVMVVSEAFDMWEMQKTTYDYGRFFKEWSEKDVSSWVRRDRSHPSIIAWSIGNEIYDTHASDHGQEITSRLLRHVKSSDPRGNGYVTQGSNFMQWENAQKCADILKVAGYNYAERLYEKQHEEHPDWMIYGSETSSVTQSRGIYHFPMSARILTDDDEQCSALGNTSPGWAAVNDEACIIPDRDYEFCAGQFIWTGSDYIGEPTPYSTKNSYFGQFDTAGFAKDSVFIFQSAWTDYKKAPFVHLYPYWDFTPGQEIDVRVATNCPFVKLFKNGELVAEKNIDQLHGKELTLDAMLIYEPGEIMAIAYDENGQELARDIRSSFGDAARIKLTADKTSMDANGIDMIFITIEAEDAEGKLVENANNRVFVEVTGAGRLVGLDNGDATDYDSYKGVSRRLFSGKLLAMIAAKEEAGEIKVKVTSPSIEGKEIVLTANECERIEGVSATTENAKGFHESSEYENDIPVRKISLVAEAAEFTADRREMHVKAVISPANASYAKDVTYRLVNTMGIVTNLAEIVSVDGDDIVVRAKGDGEFFIRALCDNGTSRHHIMSQTALKAEGLGSATFNPYEFVKGGLKTYEEGDVHNGIEKGAGFGGHGEGVIGFDDVDFGPYGSNKITLPIFANCTTAVRVRIYDGIPAQGGELLGDFEYHVPPIWMQFQSKTYTLSRTLRGMHTLCIAANDGYELEGFVFEAPVKEKIVIPAVACENIYGDKYSLNDEDITGIGNNVLIDYGNFDFTVERPVAIRITGRSAQAVNSIHVSFTGDTSARVLAEFKKSENYETQEFELNGISGKCQVSLIFLPGCDIDLKDIQFVVK